MGHMMDVWAEQREAHDAEQRRRAEEAAWFYREIRGITDRKRDAEKRRRQEAEDLRSNIGRPEYRAVVERVVAAASGHFDAVREVADGEGIRSSAVVWRGNDLEELGPLTFEAFAKVKREIESRVAKSYGGYFRATYNDEVHGERNDEVRGRGGGITLSW